MSGPGNRRACTYQALQPYLVEPITAIKLKYFTPLTREERRKAKSETSISCSQCGEKIAVMGTFNQITGKYTCDSCAIENYQLREGFQTRKAAEAHRRRLFDVGYLLTEMLTDDYLNYHEKSCVDDLIKEEHAQITSVSQELWNDIPESKKIQLQNTDDQKKIESYFRKLIYANI